MITYWIILLAIAVGVVFIAEKIKQPLYIGSVCRS